MAHPQLIGAAQLLQRLLEGIKGAVGEHPVVPPLVELNQPPQVADLGNQIVAVGKACCCTGSCRVSCRQCCIVLRSRQACGHAYEGTQTCMAGVKVW